MEPIRDKHIWGVWCLVLVLGVGWLVLSVWYWVFGVWCLVFGVGCLVLGVGCLVLHFENSSVVPRHDGIFTSDTT